MSLRGTPFLVGEYYHIYNRGVDKRIIFTDEHDYKRFRVLLYLCNNSNSVDMRALFNKGLSFAEFFSVEKGDQLVDIVAYCLMPNHFHILIKEREENGISQFMKKLLTAYSMYFNTKNERKGSLFEGKFKAKHIDSDPYLNWVFSYIHLNPINLIESGWKERGIKDLASVRDFIFNYNHSSYFDYFVGNRLENSILDKNAFLENFSQLNDFSDLIEEFRLNNN